jgi:hypothetical protein
VSLQLTTAPVLLPKYTVPEPCAVPNPEPAIVTWVPKVPELGDTLVITGVEVTIKVKPLLANPSTVTATGPVVAPPGTVTTILVSVHPVADAIVPLKVTGLLVCPGPNPEPLIVTYDPIAPADDERLVMVGGPDTRNGS